LAELHFRALEYCNRRFCSVGSGPVWGADTFSWLAELGAARDVILSEFDAYTAAGRRVPEINETEPGASKVYGPERWDMLHLYLVGHRIQPICEKFPATLGLLSRLPGLCHAKFSLLGRDRHHVPPHRDGYNGVLRMHLALRVPEGECYIRVGGRRLDWEDGQAFVFDPGVEHEVHKSACEDRLVLIADFHRPAPFWLQPWSRRFYAAIGQRPEVREVRRRYRELFGDAAEIQDSPHAI
jgi:aspartyl/asparaginyl beta-hydroxylase (cupin superfamily)